MSERGWGDPGWDGGDDRHEPLPKIEDLPISDQGYDRDAVREAFDSFYRHSAQLDATLRLLASVEAFNRQARDLRADIRSLRAASWGPAPSARHVWSVGHENWRSDEPISGSLPDALPRLAIWAALIILVGVGAALADLGTALVVVLVLGAWLLVALLEVGLSARSSAKRPPAFTALAPAEASGAPVEVVDEVEELVVEPASADDPGQATMIEPGPVADEPHEEQAGEVAAAGEAAEVDGEEQPEPSPISHVRVLRPEPAPEGDDAAAEAAEEPLQAEAEAVAVADEGDTAAEEVAAAELGAAAWEPQPVPADPWEHAGEADAVEQDTDPGLPVAEGDATPEAGPPAPARLARFRRGRR